VATVYKRNSTYWERFQWRGKEVRRYDHTTGKAAAQQFLDSLCEHRRLGSWWGARPRRTLQGSSGTLQYDYLPTLKPPSSQT
jgi:hypothetical protein